MALLFQDEYKSCQQCGGKDFIVLPVYSISKKNELVQTKEMVQCASCDDKSFVQTGWSKQ